jgi:hypothetical protein
MLQMCTLSAGDAASTSESATKSQLESSSCVANARRNHGPGPGPCAVFVCCCLFAANRAAQAPPGHGRRSRPNPSPLASGAAAGARISSAASGHCQDHDHDAPSRHPGCRARSFISTPALRRPQRPAWPFGSLNAPGFALCGPLSATVAGRTGLRVSAAASGLPPNKSNPRPPF